MGVAAFYRWLIRKYPRVQTRVAEDHPVKVNDIEIPVDATKPNPNGVEFDNLYLDMNGIVHPCCHPTHKEAPATEDKMMLEVFKCLDRVFNMIRPRKILYMALDGVAPRAKMNQQRSRRFRAAQEADEKEQDMARIAEEVFEATGERPEGPKEPWDSNCITPGTPFMELLAQSLRYYVVKRLNTDPAWKNVKVVLSDSNVPGEGEHKIMDYIRRQRMSPAHNPNTTHVLYGLDADLIMLSLATHEPHFRILREDVEWADSLNRPCRICGKKGHRQNDCRGKGKQTPNADMGKQPFVFAHIDVLREYLEYELKPPIKMPFPFDLERAIDDWVFMCFFVGNDFLPHLPSMEIREGALEKLIGFWKEELPKSGGYITHNGDVDLFRVQPIMDRIGKLEESTFKERKQKEDNWERKNKQRNQQQQQQEQQQREAADQMAAVAAANARRERETKNFAAAERLKAAMAGKQKKEETEEEEVMVSGSTANKKKRTHEDTKEEKESEEQSGQAKYQKIEDEKGESEPTTASESTSVSGAVEEESTDEVRFHESGYKERYYGLKFHISDSDTDAVHNIVEHYVRGLCWVLKYYYQGCVSWGWYYPYHYAPLASDFKDLDMMDIEFELGSPLRPYEQLMGVLPARSRHNLPKPFGPLMTEPDSPIIDFYPTDFPLDLNGKKFLWQAVVLLPFIDQKRLLDAVGAVYPELTAEEQRRNDRGVELLLVGSSNPLYDSLCDLYAGNNGQVALNPRLSSRMSGAVSCDPAFLPHAAYKSPLSHLGELDVLDDRSISVVFHQPNEGSIHTAGLLPGVRLPRRALSAADLEFARTGGQSGHRFGARAHAENNREFGHFYRQQGNDKSQDRGRGPRRYDERGNTNPAYQQHYNRPPPPRPPMRGRPMAYQPFAGGARPPRPPHRPPVRGGTPIHAPTNSGGGYRGGYRGDHRGGRSGQRNGY